MVTQFDFNAVFKDGQMKRGSLRPASPPDPPAEASKHSASSREEDKIALWYGTSSHRAIIPSSHLRKSKVLSTATTSELSSPSVQVLDAHNLRVDSDPVVFQYVAEYLATGELPAIGALGEYSKSKGTRETKESLDRIDGDEIPDFKRLAKPDKVMYSMIRAMAVEYEVEGLVEEIEQRGWACKGPWYKIQYRVERGVRKICGTEVVDGESVKYRFHPNE